MKLQQYLIFFRSDSTSASSKTRSSLLLRLRGLFWTRIWTERYLSEQHLSTRASRPIASVNAACCCCFALGPREKCFLLSCPHSIWFQLLSSVRLLSLDRKKNVGYEKNCLGKGMLESLVTKYIYCHLHTYYFLKKSSPCTSGLPRKAFF